MQHSFALRGGLGLELGKFGGSLLWEHGGKKFDQLTFAEIRNIEKDHVFAAHCSWQSKINAGD